MVCVKFLLAKGKKFKKSNILIICHWFYEQPLRNNKKKTGCFVRNRCKNTNGKYLKLPVCEDVVNKRKSLNAIECDSQTRQNALWVLFLTKLSVKLHVDEIPSLASDATV